MEQFAEFLKKIPFISKVVTFLYPVLFPIMSFFGLLSVKITSFIYFILMKLDWGKEPPTEWMDHDQDNFYQFNTNGSFLHLERGILSRKSVSDFFFSNDDFKKLKIKKSLNILDLCSGDSYISQKFFFDCALNIVSVDLDIQALQRGKKRKNKTSFMNFNQFFLKCDIETETLKELMKRNNINFKFDLVLFNAAIEHFKYEELNFIFNSTKSVMNTKSLIFGYTIVEDKNNPSFLPDHHEMFFNNKQELENIFKVHFNYTKSFQTLVNKRWNIYCVASDFDNTF